MAELDEVPTGGDRRAIPHAFKESRSLFASERLLCGWCNRESFHALHAEAAAIARSRGETGGGHAANGPESHAAGRKGTPTSDSAPDDPEPTETLSGVKACGCEGKCPSIFKPCPVCDGEVTSVAVDGALATTYRPCGHVVANTKEN